jgi:hypothetical protein
MFSIPSSFVYKGLIFEFFLSRASKDSERIREGEWWEREDIWERGAAESWRIEKFSFRVSFIVGLNVGWTGSVWFGSIDLIF